jgi:hypothetical protein
VRQTFWQGSEVGSVGEDEVMSRSKGQPQLPIEDKVGTTRQV